ncbi:MAG: type II 3-dehydroquinate dehydratase [Candidatus Palauibacterales bacterium]|nr:type II 3-dehydroquinate dehydratase [Candidatus Palauibacterales bacterium]
MTEDPARRVGVVHGPNLNLVGDREPEHYGPETLPDIEERMRRRAEERGVELVFFQSNHEGELVDWIQEHRTDVDGWVVNAGGLTHTSVALRDALVASDRPFVEVHLSNVRAREDFRERSLLEDRAAGVVSGFRGDSYVLGLEGLLSRLRGDAS